MTIMIPGPLQGLASIVVGADWPEADEDSLWRLQEAWQQAATSVEEVSRLGEDAARRVLEHVDGLVAEGFTHHWQGIDGPGGPIESLHTLLEGLGDACDEFALQTEHAKLSIIAALVALAAEIASLVAASFATFGAASAGIPVAEAATQLAVRAILRELIIEMLKGAAINAGTELAIQAYQLANHDSATLDLGAVGATALDGAVAGATGVGIGTASKGLFGTTTSGFAGAALRGGAEGALSGATANALNGLRNDGGFSGQDLLSGGLSGSVSGSRGGLETRLDGLAQTYTRSHTDEFGLGRDGGLLTGGTPGLPTPTPHPTPAPTPHPTPAPTPHPTPAPAPHPTPAGQGQPAPVRTDEAGYDGWSYARAATATGLVQDRPDVNDPRPGLEQDA
ncbi:hypothetical protein GCM10027047_35120 [Rhodococcus aerolatus]